MNYTISNSSTVGKKDSDNDFKGKFLESRKEIALPSLVITCPLNVQLTNIHQLFHIVAKKLAFGIIDEEENFATAVYRKFFSIKNFMSFFRKNKETDCITAIKLEISLNETTCFRQVKLKGLYGVTSTTTPRTPP